MASDYVLLGSDMTLTQFAAAAAATWAREKSTKINFFGSETARWGGGLPPEGVGVRKVRALLLESLSSLCFEERNLGCPGNFAGMSRTPGGVQKVCAKKVRAHFSFPSNRGTRSSSLDSSEQERGTFLYTAHVGDTRAVPVNATIDTSLVFHSDDF